MSNSVYKIIFSDKKPHEEGSYICRFKDKVYKNCLFVLRISHNLNNHDWVFLNGDSIRLGNLSGMEYSEKLNFDS